VHQHESGYWSRTCEDCPDRQPELAIALTGKEATRQEAQSRQVWDGVRSAAAAVAAEKERRRQEQGTPE
jgi:hypothetical protein